MKGKDKMADGSENYGSRPEASVMAAINDPLPELPSVYVREYIRHTHNPRHKRITKLKISIEMFVNTKRVSNKFLCYYRNTERYAFC